MISEQLWARVVWQGGLSSQFLGYRSNTIEDDRSVSPRPIQSST